MNHAQEAPLQRSDSRSRTADAVLSRDSGLGTLHEADQMLFSMVAKGRSWPDIQAAWLQSTGEKVNKGYLPKRYETIKEQLIKSRTDSSDSTASVGQAARSLAAEAEQLKPAATSATTSMGPGTSRAGRASHLANARTTQPSAGQMPQGNAPSKVGAATATKQVNPQSPLLQPSWDDFNRMDGAVSRLYDEIRDMRALMEDMRKQLALRPNLTTEPGDPVTLEILANSVTNIGSKANEVDGLKLQVELLKQRIRRLEEPDVFPRSTQSPAPNRLPSGFTPAFTYPSACGSRSSLPYHPAPGAPSQFPEPLEPYPQSSQHRNWVAVNPAMKRGQADSDGQPTMPDLNNEGITKRPKLAPLRNLDTPEDDANSSIMFDRMETDTMQTSYPTTTDMSPFMPPQSTGGENPDDSWQTSSHRQPKGQRGSHGLERGRPVVSRGRPRKSLPESMDLGTPEWERPDWTGSQISPNGYFHHTLPQARASYRGGLVRRGLGGHATSTRSAEDDNATPATFAETKRTRQKPVRNAEGVLIRKDGKPDMRSISSPNNLRKVHAKKEQDRAHGRASSGELGTPTSNLANVHSVGDEGNRRAVSEAADRLGMEAVPRLDDEDLSTLDTPKRHMHIMKQMFPGGVQKQTRKMSYAQQVFGPAAEKKRSSNEWEDGKDGASVDEQIDIERVAKGRKDVTGGDGDEPMAVAEDAEGDGHAGEHQKETGHDVDDGEEATKSPETHSGASVASEDAVG